jgi:hypothetical protein
MSPLAVRQQHRYPQGAWFSAPIAQDLSLVLALTMLLFLHPEGRLALALGAAIPATIVWNVVTLHLPSRVEVDDEGIVFCGYRREHRFAWSDIRRIHVRRFVVRDRVLVRIAPSKPWTGRYWLIDRLEGYDGLVQTLEDHAKLARPSAGGPAPPT